MATKGPFRPVLLTGHQFFGGGTVWLRACTVPDTPTVHQAQPEQRKHHETKVWLVLALETERRNLRCPPVLRGGSRQEK